MARPRCARISLSANLTRLILLAVTVLGVVVLQLSWGRWGEIQSSALFLRPDRYGRCPQPVFATDVLLVLRSGATEALEKLPVHFNTTLRCAPNYIIYSDLEEDIQGYHLYDVLDEVEESIKDNNEDFKIYKHLQEHGRQGLDEDALAQVSSDGRGNMGNPAWKLDKWKFLPMVSKALKQKPDAKWFVFLEPDTYMIWSNLLEYLTNFDHSKPYYIGRHMYVGDILFAYGGAGFAISRAAMHMASEYYDKNRTEYNHLITSQWAGDCVLGQVLKESGVSLTNAWPHLQDMQPSTLDHAVWRIHRVAWCFPVISYHHMPPAEIASLASFEQQWFHTHDAPIRHRDVFRHYILPKLRHEKANWDNLANHIEYAGNMRTHLEGRPEPIRNPVELEASKSFERCHDLCEARGNCLQFRFTEGKCFISTEVLLGREAALEPGKPQVKSGWMFERAKAWAEKMDRTCGSKVWFTN